MPFSAREFPEFGDHMTNYIEKIDKTKLPAVPLCGLIVFPRTSVSLELTGDVALAAIDAAAKNDGLAFFVLRKEGTAEIPKPEELHTVGTVARIKQTVRVSEKVRRVIVEGVNRATVTAFSQNGPLLSADLLVRWTKSAAATIRNEAYMREAIEAYEALTKYMPKLSSEVNVAVRAITSIELLADFIACHVLVRSEDKQQVLEAFDPVKRIQTVTLMMYSEGKLLETENEIHGKVQEKLTKNQREYVLREQLKVIKNELGDNTDSEIGEYTDRIRAAGLPAEIEEKLMKEVARLEKNPFGSAESAVSRNYLDACLEFPWTKTTKDRIDLVRAQRILDEDHDGLEKVKERILETLAVRKLSPSVKGQIICLVGPPGVGKTSIGASIARAMGRKYVRVSLGGVRDEADIRGHRKTYIGAMPGRIAAALTQAGTRNPVMLLDEVDKLGQGVNGDPSAALLEVLDPEQNRAFRDHYIELPVDLSDVMFIATANTLDTVPRPLIDRMEIIEMKTYTRHEKLSIAKNHMIAKQTKRCGLNRRMLKFSDEAILELIDYYTREAGVRNLEREIASICRKAARKFVAEPELKTLNVRPEDIRGYLGARRFRPDRIAAENEVGVVNGLAWTPVGGDILKLEAIVFDGDGKLELTGQLGDVMKESAHIAYSFVRSRAKELGIDAEFCKKKDIHIHVPEGAVPKDGPSAGVTLVTVLASALSGLPVKRDLAMTGEVTLTGRVLAIGGLREKTLAAYAAGVTTVLIPEENLPDLEEIDPIVRDALNFIPCRTADEVLAHALVRSDASEIIAAPACEAADGPLCGDGAPVSPPHRTSI